MKKVLIVDDSQDIRQILKKRLESAGFSVTCADGGLSFLGLLRTEEEPDVLILDLVMPERTGMDLLYTLRCKWKNVRVFIFSGHAKYKKEDYLEEFISGFFLKGEGTEALIAAIKDAVGETGAEPGEGGSEG